MEAASLRQIWVSRVERLANTTPRYLWLLKYLQRDKRFLNQHLLPIKQGSTRTILADFSSDNKQTPSVLQFRGTGQDKEVSAALEKRGPEIQLRLVFVTSVSGVDPSVRQQQLSQHDPLLRVDHDAETRLEAPVLTRSRTAGLNREEDTHPLRNHQSYLPDPDVLGSVAAALDLEPELLLRFLDQQDHFTYQSTLVKICQQAKPSTIESKIDVGFDQGSRWMTYTVGEIAKGRNRKRIRWTVFILAVEDNSIGIDFNDKTNALNQAFRPSNDLLVESFEKALRQINQAEHQEALENPFKLVWLYACPFMQSIACHVELCRREWAILCEPYALNSAVYGDANAREKLAKRARSHAQRLRYLEHSLRSLNNIDFNRCANLQLSDRNSDSDDQPINDMRGLIADTEHFIEEFKGLKSAYNTFLERQIDKISLTESRLSAEESRNLGRLSYLGFVFVPLSLACSFFSISVKPLDGETPLWIFVVTTLAILASSLLVLLLSSMRSVRDWLSNAQVFMFERTERAVDFFGHINWRWIELPGLPLTEPKKANDTLSHQSPTFQQSRTSVNKTAALPGTTVKSKEQSREIKETKKKKEFIIPVNDRARGRRAAKETELTVTKWANPLLPQEYSNVPSQIAIIISPEVTAHVNPHHLVTERSTGSTSQEIEKVRLPMEAPIPVVGGSLSPRHSVSSARLNSVDRVVVLSNSSDSVESASVSSSIRKRMAPDLFQAAYDGNVAHIGQLLGAGAEVNEKDAEGRTALCCAAEHNHLSTVIFLLENGAVPDTYHGWGNQNQLSPMALAALAQHEDVVVRLLEWSMANEIPSYRSLDQAFEGVCKKHDIASVKQLVRLCKARLENFDRHYSAALDCALTEEFCEAIILLGNAIVDLEIRQTALNDGLRKAIECGYFPSVKVFLEAGAAVNHLGYKSFSNIPAAGSPLVLACEAGSMELVKLLLQHGGDPNYCDEDALLAGPLSMAASTDHIELVTLLLKAGADVNGRGVMLGAAAGGNLEIVKLLVDAGADVNAENSYTKQTFFTTKGPLQFAAENGSDEIVHFLIQAGCAASSAWGDAAFDKACEECHESTALILADAGTNIHTTFGTRWYVKDATPSMVHAAKHGMATILKRVLDDEANPQSKVSLNELLAAAVLAGRIEIVMILLDRGADIEGGDNEAPLRGAIQENHLEVARLLLNRGADVQSIDESRKETPLHLAAKIGYVEGVEILLDYKAESKVSDMEGQTPLHLAAREGHLEVVKVLVYRASSLDGKDAEGWAPIHRAAWNKHIAVVDFLRQEGANMSAVTGDGLTVDDFLAAETSSE